MKNSLHRNCTHKQQDELKIAVIGWGSLVWDKRDLSIKESWYEDGPCLPLEFCRLSSYGKSKERVTLVIDEKGSFCETLWAICTHTNMQDAIKNLKDREGTPPKNIHSYCRQAIPKTKVEEIIAEWLKAKQEVDEVIWTGLSSNWLELRGTPFSIEDFLSYISSKEHDLTHIRNYIDKAPKQIKTQARSAFINKIGSIDANRTTK